MLFDLFMMSQICFPMHLYRHHTFIWKKISNDFSSEAYGPMLLKFYVEAEWKIAKMVAVHWPRWLPCPYMVKTFKNLLLQNQISPGALSLHKSSGTGDLPKLLKLWSYVDIWPFYGKVKFASHTFVWALYIYMGKMLRIHILDISSIIQLNWNLMMSIGALMRHKLTKWADRKIHHSRHLESQFSTSHLKP